MTRGCYRARFDLKRRHRHKLLDGRAKRSKNLLVAIVAVEVDDHLRNSWHKAAQHLSLHRREIEKAIQHQQLDLIKPRNVHAAARQITSQNLERAQLICILVRQREFIERLAVRAINPGNVAIKITLWACPGRSPAINESSLVHFRTPILVPTPFNDSRKLSRSLSGALNLANQRGNAVNTPIAMNEGRQGLELTA